MRRLEYMSILRQKLVEGGLGNDEINDALEFYEELFLDAGYENEEKTAQNLGDPEKLAQQILAENGALGFLRPEYKMEDVIDPAVSSSQQNAAPQPDYDIAPDNRNKALLIIVLCTSVVWFPLGIGLLSGAFAVAIAIIVALFSILISGVAVTILGAATCFQAPPVGILVIGVGMFLAGLGLLIAMPVSRKLFGLFKKFFTWLIGCFRKVFNNAAAQKAVNENG